jgi:hypothetical protein
LGKTLIGLLTVPRGQMAILGDIASEGELVPLVEVAPYVPLLAAQALLQTLVVPRQNAAAFSKYGADFRPIITKRTTHFEGAKGALNAAVRLFPAFMRGLLGEAERIMRDHA